MAKPRAESDTESRLSIRVDAARQAVITRAAKRFVYVIELIRRLV